MTQLTLAEALAMPAFRRVEPVVLAGEDQLGRAIRWVHATELTDLGDLLRAGDLVLTMGTGMPDDDDGIALDRYVRTLAEVESAGVVVELGRRWSTAIPPQVVSTFRSHGVPLVALTHQTRFAALAQVIGERIIDAQLVELRDAQRVHETFTELSFTQAGPAEILDAVQRLAGGPVVLENSRHRPLDYFAGSEDMGGFLDGWQVRSRRVSIAGRTGWDPVNGWLVTRLGTSEAGWGRLVIASAQPPSQRLIAVGERAAAALALHRLHDRDRDNQVRRTHREVMEALQSDPDSPELSRRCELLEFPTARRTFLGMMVRPRAASRSSGELNDLADAVVRAARGVHTPALVCVVDRDIRMVLSVATDVCSESVADALASKVLAHHQVVVAGGPAVGERRQIGESMLEASHVADAIPPTTDSTRSFGPVHRLEDLHLRGLLSLFGDDERLRLFAERELGALREHDAGVDRRAHLYSALKALLLHPASKTDAAASLHLSRAAFYDRLGKIEQVLGVNLDDPDIRVSLHVAIVCDELSRRTPN